MHRRLLELIESLRSAPNLDAFWSRTHAALEDRGVTSIFYGAVASSKEVELGRFSQSMIWRSSHSQQFFDAFGEEVAIDLDPGVEHCLTNPDILFWHNETDSEWMSAPTALRKRISIERDLGLHVGFSVSTSYFGAGHVGGIGVSMPMISPTEFKRFWADKSQEILTICGLLDTGMRSQHMSHLVHLSQREKECLVWLVAGLRPDQIADRLAISSKSVEKYILSAKKKLKATTRDHAVAKALIFKMITP
jgi:DNA-binding CsgD family transcriptional regulator